MNKNDIFEIEITGMTDEGDGVGRAQGVAIFVPYTIKGETVKVVIVKVLKNYAIGKLLEVTKPSVFRVKSECDVFYKCGGCKLWHMDYKEELRFKHQKVFDCLERIGGFKNLYVKDIVGADSFKHYRNKSQFPVTPDGIGMFAHHSHRLVETNECMIAAKFMGDIVKSVKFWMKKYSIDAYNEVTGEGVVRNIYTREGDSGVMVCIVTNGDYLPKSKELVEELLESNIKISGIIQNINALKTNVVLGKTNKTLWGKDVLIDSLDHVKFCISPLSFYQVNKAQTKKLYSLAKEISGLTGDEIIWDMYCGIGTIGQYFADNCKKVVGVEIVPDAIENARQNAKLNNIENAEYHCGKAEEIIKRLVNDGDSPNLVILDPPRKGCDKRLLELLLQVKSLEKILYISCKPSTLARDTKYLSENGFRLESVTPVDMFPRTPHVECVVLLSKVQN